MKVIDASGTGIGAGAAFMTTATVTAMTSIAITASTRCADAESCAKPKEMASAERPVGLREAALAVGIWACSSN